MQSWPLYAGVQVLSLMLLGCWQAVRRNERNRGQEPGRHRLLLALSALPLVLLLAMRYQVGIDWPAYSHAFVAIADMTTGEALSSGYADWMGTPFVFLARVLSILVGTNYLWFHGVLAVLSITLLYKGVVAGSVIPWFSLWIFLADGHYYQLFNQSRQGLAFLIVLVSYRYITERRLGAFVAAVGVAWLVHPSAIIVLPAYWLAEMRFRRRVVAVMVVAAATLPAAWATVEALVLRTGFGEAYIGSQFDAALVDTTVMRTVYRASVFGFVLFYRKAVLKRYPQANGLYMMVACAMVLQVAALQSHIFARLVPYYYLAMIFLVPYVFRSIASQRERILVGVGAFVLFGIVHIQFFVTKADELLSPVYRTWLARLGG